MGELKQIEPLSIGNMVAYTLKEDHEVVVVLNDALGIHIGKIVANEIEARALHEWLGRVLAIEKGDVCLVCHQLVPKSCAIHCGQAVRVAFPPPPAEVKP